MKDPISPEGYERALALMGECCSPHGFLATPIDADNYKRVWGRDGSIIGIAALLAGEPELVECCRQTLVTLAERQGPHGEIPSNVDPASGHVSYGGTAGRVDADLWWVIGCGQYWQRTRDESFREDVREAVARVAQLLGAWEFNTRGLLYVPPTGDWADEYISSGYVLYDNLLYLQAQREITGLLHREDSPEHARMEERIDRLARIIRTNYWFEDGEEIPEDAYHEVLYRKGREAVPCRDARFWLPFFSPLGYGYRFDAMANSLAPLVGVADEVRSLAVDAHIEESVLHEHITALPAFHPVITPRDEAWDDLQMTFSYSFKNEPYEFHNGGLWPLVNGFYVASLSSRGHSKRAREFVEGIHSMNSRARDEKPWSFPEFLHGRTLAPGGTPRMGWSAAAAVIAEQCCAGASLFDPSA